MHKHRERTEGGRGMPWRPVSVPQYAAAALVVSTPHCVQWASLKVTPSTLRHATLHGGCSPHLMWEV